MHAAFKNGLTLPNEEYVEVSVHNGQIYEAISILNHLSTMANKSIAQTGKLDSAKAELAAALALQSSLQENVVSLYRRVEAANIKLPEEARPHLVPLQKQLNHIRDQWSSFAKIIAHSWPEQAQIAVARLGEMLQSI